MDGGELRAWMLKYACPLLAAVAPPALSAGCGWGEGSPVCNEGDAEAEDGGDGGPGMIGVVGTFTNTSCPEINPIGIGPDSGGLVGLDATVTGAPPDGSVLAYTWSAPTGSFTDPHSLETSYRCPGAGSIMVTLTAAAGTCQNQTIGFVMCQMVYAGP